MFKRIISIFTFPGVIIHEGAHKIMCDFFGIKVYKVVYFSPMSNTLGYVQHEEPQKYYQTFGISVGPFLFNSLLAIIFSIIAANFFEKDSFLCLFFFWLALSSGMHAFPSDGDAQNLLRQSKQALKQWYNPAKYGHLLTFPFVFLIWIINELKILGIDFFYALSLIYLTIINI